MRVSFTLMLCALFACGSTQTGHRGTPRTSSEAGCPALRLGQGLDLVILGSGGPRSAGRAASSYLIAIDGTPRMLVDVGSGAFTRLGESGLPSDELDTYLLTHLHIDHVGDLPDIVKSRDLAADTEVKFRIFGPSSRGEYPSTTELVNRLFGKEGAFAYLPGFRNALNIDVTDVPADGGDEPRMLLDEAGVRVSSVEVDHGDVPALAYRIESRGRSVVVSGDLASKRAGIVKLAKGASVLVYDAAVLDPPGSPEKLYELHTPPRRIGEIAAEAGVETLILSHVSPATERHAAEVLSSVRASFTGDVRFASDCMHVPLDEANRQQP